jgi:ankyrin repeat protein
MVCQFCLRTFIYSNFQGNYSVRIIIYCSLKMGADINAVNNSGDTPLHIAVRSGFTLLASRLVDVGADVTIQNLQALTPWQSALVSDLATF